MLPALSAYMGFGGLSSGLAVAAWELNGAGRLRADHADMTALQAFDHDGIGHVLAWFLLWGERLLALARFGKMQGDLGRQGPVRQASCLEP
jgi:hypothetical protein